MITLKIITCLLLTANLVIGLDQEISNSTSIKKISIVSLADEFGGPENVIKARNGDPCIIATFKINIHMEYYSSSIGYGTTEFDVPTKESNLSTFAGACKSQILIIGNKIYHGPVIVYLWNWPKANTPQGQYDNRLEVKFQEGSKGMNYIDRLSFRLLLNDDSMFINPMMPGPDEPFEWLSDDDPTFPYEDGKSSYCENGKTIYADEESANVFSFMDVTGRYELNPDSAKSFSENDYCVEDVLLHLNDFSDTDKYVVIGVICGGAGLIIWTGITYIIIKRWSQKRRYV